MEEATTTTNAKRLLITLLVVAAAQLFGYNPATYYYDRTSSVHSIDSTSEYRAFGDSSHDDIWEQWLTEHDAKANHTKVSILDTKEHSGSLGGGCGISLILSFESRQNQTASSAIPSSNSRSTKAFFKISHAKDSNPASELHIREIKAYYLDRILQTNVVPPCVGYNLDRRQLANVSKWEMISENLQCQEAEGHKTATSAQGSMMLWTDGIEVASEEQMMKSATNTTLIQDEPDEFTSAMNYVFFHYLGANIKSEQNHFVKVLDKGDDEREHIYVAIDNDRSLIPKAICDNDKLKGPHRQKYKKRYRQWKHLVYERICHIPHDLFPVVGLIRDVAKSNNTLARVSTRFKLDMETDVLAKELFASQPEVFEEVDERVQELADYINTHCPDGGVVDYTSTSS